MNNMDTEYAYDPEELTYEQQMDLATRAHTLAGRQTRDINIERLRTEDYSEPSRGRFDRQTHIGRFTPHEIQLYLTVRVDKLQTRHFAGTAWQPGRRVLLDAYPNAMDYRLRSPGSETKSLMLRCLDEIHTEGALERLTLLEKACAGRITYQGQLVTNHAFIWIPGDRRQQHQIVWFVDQEEPQVFRLLKQQNLIWWRQR